ncbi:MAG: hypothetical protein AABO57_08275 [Acidobacteriota bacterium]
MKENELIGIAGVFVLTLCLIALYHLMGKFGRHGKRYDARIKRAKQPEQDQRPDHDPRTTSGKDDAWLLWNPELDERDGPSKAGLPDHHETRGPWLRS